MTYSLPPKDSDSVALLQITDTHLFANKAGCLLGVSTQDSYRAVLDAIAQQKQHFDAIIATGDISQDHSEVSYRTFADGIARWSQPCFWLPGNHDYQPSMQTVLPSPQIKACEQVLFGEHWQAILLDSQVEGVPHGELSAEQLALLDKALTTYPERHALILLHHHPLPVSSAWLDQHQLHNTEMFWSVVKRHQPQVKAVVCGHIHQELNIMHHGVKVIATPSTCVQFLPDSDDFALDSKAPGWRYLELKANGDIHTQVYRLLENHFIPDLKSAGY